MYSCSSICERKKRWVNFLEDSGQPHHLYQIEYLPDQVERPFPTPDNRKKRIEWSWNSYQRHMQRMEWLEDDSIPCLDVYTGTEIFAEAFGCPVYRPNDNMPFAMPLIHSSSDVAKLKIPDLNCEPISLVFDIADELKRRGGKDAILKLADIQSPMDIAALIWDKNDFYPALILEPESVKELAEKVKTLLFNFLDEWFNRYGSEFISHYPHYYMPDGITVSEDEIGAISEDMFSEFFLPELTEMSERYGRIGVHCCANAKHQWELFKKIPRLQLLNLIQPENTIKEAYEFFADSTGQMHSWCGNGPAWTWPNQLPDNSRVVLQAKAANKDEALDLAKKLGAACGR